MTKLLESPKLGAFIISFTVVMMFAFTLAWVMIRGVADNPSLQLILGALIGAFTATIQYWIGSSSSSKDKDDVIAQQAATSAVQSGAPVPPPSPAKP